MDQAGFIKANVNVLTYPHCYNLLCIFYLKQDILFEILIKYKVRTRNIYVKACRPLEIFSTRFPCPELLHNAYHEPRPPPLSLTSSLGRQLASHGAATTED